MGSKVHTLRSNFSKGELSPRMDGRPDLFAYFEGAKELTNWTIFRQGGVTRRPGTRFVAEVKDSSKDTILLPFEFSVDDAYVLEVGHLYNRVYKNGSQVQFGGAPVEIATPYVEADIRTIHFTQSADVLYLFHSFYAQRKLGRVSDTSWALSTISFKPPASYEADVNLNAALVYHQASGLDTGFLSLNSIFLAADVGRLIIAGAGRAIITSLVNATEVRADILDAFDSTKITAGPSPLSSVGITVTTTQTHGLQTGDWIRLISGAQLGEFRRVTAAPTATTATIASAFSIDQNGVDWTRHVPLAVGKWTLRSSPQTALNPDKREPVGTKVVCKTSVAAFRSTDVDKFIFVFGGLIKITSLVSSTEVNGEILSILTGMSSATPTDSPGTMSSTGTAVTTSQTHGLSLGDRLVPTSGAHTGIGKTVVDIPTETTATVDSAWSSNISNKSWRKHIAAPAGAWTLEEVSWSDARGYPRTGEFFQGRLGQASTVSQPTTFWLSVSDNYENYAVGTKANDAIEHTPALRKLNRIEWITDNSDLILATSGAEILAKGERNGEPMGGDKVPLIERMSGYGSAPIQPVIFDRKVLFLDRSQRKLLMSAYSFEDDAYGPTEITAPAEHITGTGIRLGPIGVKVRLDPQLYFVRNDGRAVTLTYFPKEKVVGFTTWLTDGIIESMTVIPASTRDDQVWMVVKRTINGQTKRFIEYCDTNAFPSRAWPELMTDCAVVYNGAATTTITGLSHLEGKTVDVIADGSFIGTKVVASGQVTLETAASSIEVGLHYESIGETMRPAIEGSMIEGLPRSWDKLFIRLLNTRGGTLNGETIQYVPDNLDKAGLFTGDMEVTGIGWDTEGRVTFKQTQPYPMTVLAIFGTLSVGDHA